MAEWHTCASTPSHPLHSQVTLKVQRSMGRRTLFTSACPRSLHLHSGQDAGKRQQKSERPPHPRGMGKRLGNAFLSSTGAIAPSGPSAGEALPQDKLRHTAGETPERLSGPGWTGLPFTWEFHSSIILPREQTNAHQEEGFPKRPQNCHQPS